VTVADRKDDIKARLMATFRVEAEEHLQALTANLLALERGVPPPEVQAMLEATFREMHTLKGAARSVGLMEVEAVCQACESLLSRLSRGQLKLTREVLRRLQEAVDSTGRLVAGGEPVVLRNDLIRRLNRAAADPGAAEQPIAAPTAAPPAAAGPVPQTVAPPVETLRVATAKLDALSLQAEDLLVPKLAAGERAHEARALAEALTACCASLDHAHQAARSGQAAAAEAELTAGLEPALRALGVRARELVAHTVRDQRAIAGAVDELLEETRRLRMMPASSVLDIFPRMVRDLAEEQGKEVEWVVRGDDLEVDRKVLEAAKDPLIHLVRNAIDHGIEPSKARAEAGKALRGRVAVTVAALEGGRIEIRVEDDGRGIDLARVREAAVRAGLLSSEAAEALTNDDALDLIYRSGLSTSPIITNLSGHGLGLPIVKERVERLGGRIDVQTRAGAGTTITMVVPASIATFRGLLVRAGGQPFLLPIEAVERAIRVAPEDVETVEGREAVRGDGHPLFLARLSGLLGLPEAAREPRGKSPCVIVRFGEERLGLLVEEVSGDREVVVKDLRAPLVRVRNVAGAGLLGTGEVVLILRATDLLRSSQRARRPSAPPPAPEAKRQAAVLVVDDSITTRTMEKNLLEAAGYRVRVAVDGIDAWTVLKSEAFDLVVSDVDMPRMDGFDLTARIRADKQLSDLPVILVTALESREDKERGIEVGANAYIVKSSFDQSNLLEIIGRLA
jgi:two-component system chemotaxis sensor kinase CheA